MEKIAVVGLSCLFPGAETPEAFWRNLQEGRDTRSLATDEKMGVPVREYYDPRKGTPDRFYCSQGGYVRDFEMDPNGFDIAAETCRAYSARIGQPCRDTQSFRQRARARCVCT